jgi:hypothetical protein
METSDRHAGFDSFEVILCFENNSWLFSTYAETFQVEDALDKAEDEFLIHSALHDLSMPRATSAFVLTERGKHFYSKRNGRWQTAAAMPSPASGEVIAFSAGERQAGNARATAH